MYIPRVALQIGILGLPNVGKSTLFNALTRSRGANVANYPFCTIEPNVGIVAVPDGRLAALAALVKPAKVVPATIEFVDIAGLVKGASKGEGLGNQFLARVREVHALCHVVRVFSNADVVHVDGNVDPARDRETIETELILADMESLTKRREKIRGAAKTGNKEKQKEFALTEKILSALNDGVPAIAVGRTPEEEKILQTFNLLTAKPLIYACNIDDGQLGEMTPARARSQLGVDDAQAVICVDAKIEEDLQDLTPQESADYLKEIGVEHPGLDNLIRAAYGALGYLTFFTAGPTEVRAWNVRAGATAPQAAGVLHTDFERGFICAETIAYDAYIACGGEAEAKEAGKMRQEGKTYVLNDGDVMFFKFNV